MVVMVYKVMGRKDYFGYLTKMVGSGVVEGSRDVVRYFGMVDRSMVGFGGWGITLVGLGMDRVAFVFDIRNKTILIGSIGHNLNTTVG